MQTEVQSAWTRGYAMQAFWKTGRSRSERRTFGPSGSALAAGLARGDLVALEVPSYAAAFAVGHVRHMGSAGCSMPFRGVFAARLILPNARQEVIGVARPRRNGVLFRR